MADYRPNPKPSFTFELGGSQFLVLPSCLEFGTNDSSLRDELSSGEIMPVTILNAQGIGMIDANWLRTTINRMLEEDDVINRDFAYRIMLRTAAKEGKIQLAEDVPPFLASQGCALQEISVNTRIYSGPYVLRSSKIHKVYRLYSDSHGAFVQGMIQTGTPHERYERLESNLIPVPSRLYFKGSNNSRPLNGKRIAIKDVIDICGVKTTAGSAAFENLHGKASTTASSIQKLIDLGAVIVGKTKTTQFASGEYPQDWVDHQCPFNPRGDGYFDTACSSAGSAVAIAAYEWLDYSIGTDTLGSMTEPAAAQGIYGVRPTHGTISLDGILPGSLVLDTPGYFSRSILELEKLGEAWYGGSQWESEFQPPKAILVPTELFEPYPATKRAVMMNFIDNLGKAFNMLATPFDVAALWDKKAPKACTRPLTEYLHNTVAHIYLHDSDRVDNEFRTLYKAEFGHEPYVNPMIMFKWRVSSEVTERDYKKACNEMEIFRQFVREQIFVDNTIMILPGGEKEVLYRDQYLGPPEKYGYELQGFGFHHKVYSCLGGLPQIVVPIGQREILSKVKHTMVYEPISIIIVGPARSDGYLIQVIKQALASSGLPFNVEVGSAVYPNK